MSMIHFEMCCAWSSVLFFAHMLWSIESIISDRSRQGERTEWEVKRVGETREKEKCQSLIKQFCKRWSLVRGTPGKFWIVTSVYSQVVEMINSDEVTSDLRAISWNKPSRYGNYNRTTHFKNNCPRRDNLGRRVKSLSALKGHLSSVRTDGMGFSIHHWGGSLGAFRP